MNLKGFTLTELLTAIVIVTILTVMAVPMYEKTIERSHLAEARTIMNRLQEAKLAAMDNMDCESYVYDASSAACPQLQHLGVSFADESKTGKPAASGRSFSTKYFQYSLSGGASDTYPNGICAKRIGGDYNGTVFAYYYVLRQDSVEVGDEVGAEVGAEFKCKGSMCEDYGFTSDDSLVCTFE